MVLEYPDGALGVLLASRAALDSAYGENAFKIVICVAMVMQAHRLSDLRSFACLQVLHTTTASSLMIDVLHDGVGLRAQLIDGHRQPITDPMQLDESRVDRLSVVAVVAAPAIAGTVRAG